MNKFEKDLWQKGYKLVGGLDEVGRGCIAGPLVCAIVIFPKNYNNNEIRDSKQLTHKKRLILSEIIKKDAIAYRIEIIDPLIVDQINPKQASRLGMKMCVKNIDVKPDFLLIDFEKIETNIEQISITKGDQKSISIAAASIIAKVFRDELMDKIDKLYPHYDFKNNKGYLTRNHLYAIKKFGPLKNVHRYSYKPISK